MNRSAFPKFTGSKSMVWGREQAISKDCIESICLPASTLDETLRDRDPSVHPYLEYFEALNKGKG
jgi:hypothetical protein